MKDREEVPGGFIVHSDKLDGYVYVLKGSWHSKYRTLIDGKKIIGLRLSRSMGWVNESLSFLENLPPASKPRNL